MEIHSDIPADRVDLLRRATGLDLGESEAIVLADLSETKTLLMIVARPSEFESVMVSLADLSANKLVSSL